MIGQTAVPWRTIHPAAPEGSHQRHGPGKIREDHRQAQACFAPHNSNPARSRVPAGRRSRFFPVDGGGQPGASAAGFPAPAEIDELLADIEISIEISLDELSRNFNAAFGTEPLRVLARLEGCA